VLHLRSLPAGLAAAGGFVIVALTFYVGAGMLVYTSSMKQIITNLRDFQIKIAKEANWLADDLELLYSSITLLADVMGGRENFTRLLGEVLIERTDVGSKLALAYKDKIQLSATGQLSAWSVIHELAHVWDAKNGWKLSLKLEEFTGGMTDPKLSEKKKGIPEEWDAGLNGAESKPGFYDRKPGVNALRIFLRRQAKRLELEFQPQGRLCRIHCDVLRLGAEQSAFADGAWSRRTVSPAQWDKRPDIWYCGQLVGLRAVFLSRWRGLCANQKMGIC
jgi:hypothetical protein